MLGTAVLLSLCSSITCLAASAVHLQPRGTWAVFPGTALNFDWGLCSSSKKKYSLRLRIQSKHWVFPASLKKYVLCVQCWLQEKEQNAITLCWHLAYKHFSLTDKVRLAVERMCWFGLTYRVWTITAVNWGDELIWVTTRCLCVIIPWVTMACEQCGRILSYLL